MKTKSVIALAVVAAIAVAAAFWVTSERAPETNVNRDQALIPGLKGTVNDVTVVKLVKAGDQPVATLKRGEHGWTVAEKNDYPADIRKIRNTLLGLANAEIIEEKTTNPELYDRLGVQDISKADASGVQVTLEGLAKPIALIIGNYAAQPGDGTYVRRATEAQSWLVSGNLTPDKETRQWLNQVILDIPAERIQSVTVQQPNGELLSVAKEKRLQTSFTVLDVPQGRELISEGAGNVLGGALATLRLEDVQPVSALDPGAHEGVAAEYHTFDGLIIEAKAFEAQGAKYVHVTAAFDEDQAQRYAEADQEDQLEDTAAPVGGAATATGESEEEAKAAESEQGTEAGTQAEEAGAEPEEGSEETAGAGQAAPASATDATEAPTLSETELATLREEAERLNARLGPWVYAIPSYQYDSMVKRMDDLLKPVAKETVTTPEQSAGEPSGTE